MILPAFGVTVGELQHLREKGCVLVDTTCGSVLNVWKNVHSYARDGYTAVIHGKHYHEETKATASQALTHAGGQFLIVRDRAEAEIVCDFIRGEARCGARSSSASRGDQPRLRPRARPPADRPREPDHDADDRELEIQEMLRAAMRERHGDAALADRFRAFDTICSATQDRQDAVLKMLGEGGLDVMVVIGGYNSSNTQALAAHLRRADAHLPHQLGRPHRGRRSATGRSARHDEVSSAGLAAGGPVTVGLTAGASTPNNVVGEVVERVLALRGRKADELVGLEPTLLGREPVDLDDPAHDPDAEPLQLLVECRRSHASASAASRWLPSPLERGLDQAPLVGRNPNLQRSHRPQD